MGYTFIYGLWYGKNMYSLTSFLVSNSTTKVMQNNQAN